VGLKGFECGTCHLEIDCADVLKSNLLYRFEMGWGFKGKVLVIGLDSWR